MFNPYIDFENIDDPFKIGNNELHRILFDPVHITEAKINIKENTYDIDDSYMFSNPNSGKFYTSESLPNNYRKYDNSLVYGIIKFNQNSETTLYVVAVYSFLDMTSAIGGIFGIVSILLSIVVNYISQKTYLFSLISKISKNETEINNQLSNNIHPYILNNHVQPDLNVCKLEKDNKNTHKCNFSIIKSSK